MALLITSYLVVVVKASGLGPGGSEFESRPGQCLMSLGKIFTKIFLVWPGVLVTGCGLRKGTSFILPTSVVRVQGKKYKKYSYVILETEKVYLSERHDSNLSTTPFYALPLWLPRVSLYTEQCASYWTIKYD